MALVDLATNELGRDAWGRPKVILDYSLFHGMWTFSVPNRVWLQYNDTGSGYTEQSQIDNNLVKSINGHLEVTGNSTTDTALVSKRHPRYQPNKGLLYSSAVIAPEPELVGIRQFGIMSETNGLFFEIVGDGDSYVVNIVRRTTIDGITTNHIVNITDRLPDEFGDVDKGHVYDIQMEWRGVGNLYIFVDLELVYTFELLGTLTGMSVSNPALHVGYTCEGAGVDPIVLRSGCVDVTAEGGVRSNKLYTSVSTGTTLLPTKNAGVAMIGLRLPIEIDYNGDIVRYTRDMIFTELSTFCKDEAFRTVYFARLTHVPNLAGMTWEVKPDTFYEFKTNADGTLDTAFQLDKSNMQVIYSTRTEKDFASSHQNPDPDNADFYLTGGDMIIVEFLSDGNSTGGCTLELAEEV